MKKESKNKRKEEQTTERNKGGNHDRKMERKQKRRTCKNITKERETYRNTDRTKQRTKETTKKRRSIPTAITCEQNHLSVAYTTKTQLSSRATDPKYSDSTPCEYTPRSFAWFACVCVCVCFIATHNHLSPKADLCRKINCTCYNATGNNGHGNNKYYWLGSRHRLYWGLAAKFPYKQTIGVLPPKIHTITVTSLELSLFSNVRLYAIWSSSSCVSGSEVWLSFIAIVRDLCFITEVNECFFIFRELVCITEVMELASIATDATSCLCFCF
jgi:hypothetical protein